MDNSLKNENGKNTKAWVESYLKAERITYKKNVYAPANIYNSKKAHFEITKPDGSKLYVITAGDLFDGGLQSTMLELIYQGSKTWTKGQIFFVVQRANMDKGDDRKTDAWKAIENQFAGDIEAMRRIYDGIMPENKST